MSHAGQGSARAEPSRQHGLQRKPACERASPLSRIYASSARQRSKSGLEAGDPLGTPENLEIGRVTRLALPGNVDSRRATRLALPENLEIGRVTRSALPEGLVEACDPLGTVGESGDRACDSLGIAGESGRGV